MTKTMKKLQFRNFIFLLLLLVPGKAFCQDDILYRKDSKVLIVSIKAFDGKTIRYQIPGDTAGQTYYISNSVLDSLRNKDGKSVNFTQEQNITNIPLKKTGRNYFSVELVNLFTGKPNLEYERISGTGGTGFIIGFLINRNLTDYGFWEEDHYIFNYANFSPHYFFIRTGVNFYPFSKSLTMARRTRTSTGFSLLIGAYRKIDYTTYYENGFKTVRVPAGSLMWNFKEKVFLSGNIVLTGAVELSVIPFLTFICPQFGVSIGF
jgi:hypothetical protein